MRSDLERLAIKVRDAARDTIVAATRAAADYEQFLAQRGQTIPPEVSAQLDADVKHVKATQADVIRLCGLVLGDPR